jgi:hypothetical protein
MTRTSLAFALLLPLTTTPAWADSADGTYEEPEEQSDSGEEEDDKGCSHMATPVTGLSLILGAALALGLRRR